MPDRDNSASGAPGPLVLTLCTGNAARSVMAGAMLSASGVRVMTAGTHVVEGQPMSRRTRDALGSVGVRADGHRSHQVTPDDLERADLVLAMATEHVAFVRRRHPEAAGRTATIRRLVRDLAPAPGRLGDRLTALGLATVPLEAWEDVADPAGGEDEHYVACATDLAGLTAALVPLLG